MRPTTESRRAGVRTSRAIETVRQGLMKTGRAEVARTEAYLLKPLPVRYLLLTPEVKSRPFMGQGVNAMRCVYRLQNYLPELPVIWSL